MTDNQQRIDRWLWFARQFKTRTLAAKMVTSGKIRINNQRINKPSQTVQPGDTITYVANRKIKILKVCSTGTRRGPAIEAVLLYEDLSPPDSPRKQPECTAATSALREEGTGRPTKKQRREIDALMDRGA